MYCRLTNMLSGVEAIHVATVLEDCVDQLAILGRIMPVSYEEKPDADEVRLTCCKIAKTETQGIAVDKEYSSIQTFIVECIGHPVISYHTIVLTLLYKS